MVVAPPPHYQRPVSYREWIAGILKGGGRTGEAGPSGETIVRTGFLPSGKSLTSRALNQGFVALASLATIFFPPRPLREFQPDVVIGTVPALPTAMVTLLASRRFSSPYIIDLRDAWPELLDIPEEWNRAVGNRSIREKILSLGPMQIVAGIARLAINESLKKASGLLLTSAHLKDHLLLEKESGFRGNTRQELAVVRNVFPPETQYGHVVSYVEQRKASLKVLYAGTLGRAQNLANAVYAVGIARQSGINVDLRLVGAGASKSALHKLSMECGIPVTIESRQPADGLEAHYEWADTALVHLSSWTPLQRAVPSKTYELMECGIHISGVVSGETAELIRHLEAGDVVPPDDPQSLAELWIGLAIDKRRLNTSRRAADWVRCTRNDSTNILLSFIENIASNE